MSSDLPESDWRHFKVLHKTLLDRYCTHVLSELTAASQAVDGTAHERYLRTFELIQKRNQEMAHAFDDFRRSTAIMQLAIMRRMRLLTDDDLSVFSEPTRTHVRAIASL